MDTLRYLAYGSNLYPPRLAHRIGAFETVAGVRLDGWALSFAKIGADGSGKCNLAPAPDGIAYGVVYEMPRAARPVLDKIEGVGRGYEGTWLDLGSAGRCYTYLAEERYLDPRLYPFEWYKTLVVEGARHHGFSRGYIAGLAAVTAVADPDPARSEENLRVFRAPG